MISVVQGVGATQVVIDDGCVGKIGSGLPALLAVVPDDGTFDVEYIAERLQDLRVFADEAGRMNLSVQETAGNLLLVVSESSG